MVAMSVYRRLKRFSHDQKSARRSGGCLLWYQGTSPSSMAIRTLISIPRSLVSILKSSSGPQMTYQVAFCLWLLTFETDVAQEINKFVLRLIFNQEHANWLNSESMISSHYLQMLLNRL
jgi:V-ATPase subunit H